MRLSEKVKKCSALNDTPSQSYGMSFAMWDYTSLPATTQVNIPPAVHRWEFNSHSVDHKSEALTTTQPSQVDG